MNPFLENHYYVPDAEAHVWQDGRLYIYGSYDLRGADSYCSTQYHVFSTDDMLHWVDHGVSLESQQIPWMQPTRPLYAPDCAYKNGKYYLYFCYADRVGREGVAVSNHPYGPFTNPVPVIGADGGGIDPAVLVDDDGQAYLYWGQFHLQGAKLDETMTAIVPGTQRTLISEETHGFHEGACIRKVNGKYILVYADISRGSATCLGHAVSDTPLGQYSKKGIVIDNTSCDKRTWNNHGSICKFKDQWYVFYHRSSLSSRFNRRACVEPISIQPDGTICEVEMTTQGVGPPIDASQQIEAYRACYLFGDLTTCYENDEEILTGGTNGDFASYKYLMFNGQTSFHALVKGQGRINVHLDQCFRAPICTLEVESAEDWAQVTRKILLTSGLHSLHLVFQSGSIAMKNFQFH
jgi:arabinoxylan arabinofuranohydrolase